MTIPSQKESTKFAWLTPSLLVIIFLSLIAAGYGVFLFFVSSKDTNIANLYLVAMVAGIASFFSPCAFPLLPSYLSFYQEYQDKQLTLGNDLLKLLRFGGAAALGVITFDLVLGVLISLLGEGIAQSMSITGPEPNQLVLVFRGIVGGFLLLLGVGQLRGWNLKPRLADSLAYHTRPERIRQRGPSKKLFLYGLGYNASGMGCTGPILAGLMLLAVSSGGFVQALTAFGVFSITMGVLMLMVSGLVANLQNNTLQWLKKGTPRIRHASSTILVLVGIFYLYSAFNVQSFTRLLFPE